jgi:hypothetical protein
MHKTAPVLDLRRILRFSQYLHAIPLAPLNEMEFHPAADAQGDELGILWLRPRVNYPLYLRERRFIYNQKQTVTRSTAEMRFDGDPTDHVVAIAILRKTTSWQRGFFERRTWWVKSYDAFHGYRLYHNQNGTCTWYDCGGPSEAVMPQLVIPNQESKGGWNLGDHSTLRPWDGSEPKLHRIDWSQIVHAPA